MRDSLFADRDAPDDAADPVAVGDTLTGFRFDAEVVRVFPDMIDRSVPGYASIVRQTGLLAARFAQAGTALHDLGCSLGASALSMRAALASDDPRARTRECVIHGVDSSAAMIARAGELVAAEEAAFRAAHPAGGADGEPGTWVAPRIALHHADLLERELEPCSVVAMNFTLQFVAPEARPTLLGRIARALVPGGVLILSEKLRFADPRIDALHVDMHHAFKRANGYSALEVARKRAALEHVLVPDTLETHAARLRAAGFARSSVWFQCFNFASLLAVRD